jgi:hypothetical protein
MEEGRGRLAQVTAGSLAVAGEQQSTVGNVNPSQKILHFIATAMRTLVPFIINFLIPSSDC